MFQTDDREELRELLNAFQVAMYAIEMDCSGSLICAGHNDLGTELTGFSPEDVIEKPLAAFMEPKDAVRATASYMECFETGKPVHASFDVRFPTGPLILASNVVPVFGPDNSVRRLIGNAVGLKFYDDFSYQRLLDDLTRLSVAGAATLFDALRAIEVRRESGDITPAEEQFLTVFGELSERALKHSLAIRDKLRIEGKCPSAEEHFLKEGALAKAILDLTGSE